MANFNRQLVWKIYTEAGIFVETLDDVISDLSIEKQIFGGDSEFSFRLDRKMDDFDENTSIKFNNRVKVYLKDDYNTAGTKLVANGYIVTYSPYLRGKEEGIEVTCLSAVSKLSNDFYRTGTAAAASDLGVELTTQRADQMMQAIINHYRSTETNSMITNDFTDVEQTTDNDGVAFTFDHRFFNMKHLDALRETSKFLPRNKTGGYWFYWRINTDGDLFLKNLSTSAQHTFMIGKHITEIDGEKTIEGVVNRVYFWNEKGTLDPDYLKITADDTTSQTDNDIIADYITDSKITNPNAAGLLAESRVYDKKDPKVKIKIKLNENYDLASIEPGQTCQILNAKNNPYKIGSDGVLIIQSIQYEVDSATLELSEAADNFEDIVEEERQRLDKEMTWFGYITQALTAAQLGPANRTWSTDLIFSATSGANSYRQVDWAAGIVYIPTGATGDSSKRIIEAGNTGLLSPGTDYFIYLDEETFNTSASNSDSGTGTIKQGGDVLLDSSKSWSVDQYKGLIVTIGGQTKIIKSNTSTVLTIEDRWTISDQTSAYTIKKMSFDVTTNKSAISDLTKIVFSNVRANDITSSEAIITTTQGTSSVFNYNIDGSQIAKRSISANEIIANTITANEINTSGINIGDWAGTLDNVDDGSSYGKTTFNQVTGSGRAYLGLDSSNRITVGFYDTSLSSITLPTNGLRIDANGIFGRKSGVTTFYIDTTGSAYFSGTVSASTITGSTLSTASSGQRTVLTETTGDYYDSGGTKRASIFAQSTGLYLEATGTNSVDISSNGTLSFSMGSTSNISNRNLLPLATVTYDLGSSSDTWQVGYINKISGNSGANVIDFGYSGRIAINQMFGPASGAGSDLGNATYYWNEVNYKTLTDRGCFGWYDEGVELQDGRIVSDIQALKEIKKHPTLKTPRGASRFDYSTMPKHVYVKATDQDGKLLTREKDTDLPYLYETNIKTKKKKKIYAEDGAELSALVSIMIGAIKELDNRLEKLEQ